MANYQDILEQQVENSLLQINKEKIRENLKKESVQNYILKLEEINSQLKQYVEKRKSNNRWFKWSEVLDGAFYIINFEKVKEEEEKEFIQNKIFEGYEITSLVLQELGLINKITNVVSFIDDDYNYVRIDNFKFDVNYTYLNPTASRRGKNYGLRLRQSELQIKIEEAKANRNYEIINAHFKGFIEPFVNYQRNNKTGWKINKGVLAETFQRHWEKNHAGYTEGSLPEDFESIGRRWWMYRESSGSDPYFTGPDTDIAQVKNTNASLVSNVNTVLNTIKGILQLLNQENLLKYSEESISRIFKQKQMKPTLSKKIYDGLDNKARQQVINAMKEIFGDNAELHLTK